MALFGKKKNTEEKKKVIVAPTTSTETSSGHAADLSHVLGTPRISEKSTMMEERNIYTFNVALRTNKREIMQAVQALYKVKPLSVRIVTIPTKIKRSARTGRVGVHSGGKKAYVYLKAGDSITIR